MTSIAKEQSSNAALEGFANGINRVVMSPDGRLLATTDVDMNLVVRMGAEVIYTRNLSSDNEKIKPTERVRGLKFSADSKTLFLAAGDRIDALSTENWGSRWNYVAPRSFGFLIISPISLDVSETGDVVAAFDNGSFMVWDGEGTHRISFRDNDSPRWLRFTADGSQIVGSDSFSLCCWSVQERKKKFKLGLIDRAYAMDVDRFGRIAAMRTLQDIVVRDLITKEILSVTPVGPGTPVVAVHPILPQVAFVEKNHVRVITFEGEVIDEFALDVASALSLSFNPAGDQLGIGCTENHLVVRPFPAA